MKIFRFLIVALFLASGLYAQEKAGEESKKLKQFNQDEYRYTNPETGKPHHSINTDGAWLDGTLGLVYRPKSCERVLPSKMIGVEGGFHGTTENPTKDEATNFSMYGNCSLEISVPDSDNSEFYHDLRLSTQLGIEIGIVPLSINIMEFRNSGGKIKHDPSDDYMILGFGIPVKKVTKNGVFYLTPVIAQFMDFDELDPLSPISDEEKDIPYYEHPGYYHMYTHLGLGIQFKGIIGEKIRVGMKYLKNSLEHHSEDLTFFQADAALKGVLTDWSVIKAQYDLIDVDGAMGVEKTSEFRLKFGMFF